jgi:hypothetical protein
VGFWGICDKCKPIEGTLPELNTWLQRAENRQNYPEQKGTTITILGFEPSSDWRKLLAISVAENFFGAIAKSMLEVNIDDQITLAHDSIHDFFENPEMLDAVQNQKDEPERFNNCKSYLLAIQNQNEVQVEPTENRDLGLCTMRLLVRDGMPKKICILRNGMLITDELNRLKSFSDFKDFVAVLECNSSKGNQFLRDMEPPRHDDFEPERLPRKLQSTGKKALSDLAKWARDMLKRHAKNPISNITTLDELKDFFGDEFSNGEGKETEEINPAGEIVIRARPLPRKSTETTTSGIGAGDGGGFSPRGGNGSGGEEGESGGGSTSGKGEGEGEGTGGSGGHDIKSSQKLFNVRAIMTSMDSRRITFTPTVTGEVCLRLMRAGADTDHNIDVIESSGGLIKGGRIIVKVNDGCRITLDVKMERKFDGSIRIVAHEV